MQYDKAEAGIQFFCTPSGKEELFLVASNTGPGATPARLKTAYNLIAAAVKQHDAVIVQERVFCGLRHAESVKQIRDAAYGDQSLAPSPYTFIDGCPPWGQDYAGTIIRAVHRSKVLDITVDLKHAAYSGITRWQSGASEFTLIQGLHGLDGPAEDTKEAQTRRIFERAEHLLNAVGATYGNVVRTWFYLNDILAWYTPFNQVRNDAYHRFDIMPKPGDTTLKLPASTGIGGIGLRGAAAVVDILAVTHCPAESCARQLHNAGQQDAFQYGSAFSRGAHIRANGSSIIELSGTASIDTMGNTIHLDDTGAQIQCTFDKIDQLLAPEGVSCQDFAAACVFIKDGADYPRYQQLFQARGIERFPAVFVQADVCRDNLLFEIDGELVVS